MTTCEQCVLKIMKYGKGEYVHFQIAPQYRQPAGLLNDSSA